jgi:hypothetical protein
MDLSSLPTALMALFFSALVDFLLMRATVASTPVSHCKTDGSSNPTDLLGVALQSSVEVLYHGQGSCGSDLGLRQSTSLGDRGTSNHGGRGEDTSDERETHCDGQGERKIGETGDSRRYSGLGDCQECWELAGEQDTREMLADFIPFNNLTIVITSPP